MKEIILSVTALFCFARISYGQVTYLPDIHTKKDNRNSNGYLMVPFSYWRFDSCLHNDKMCKYNHSTAADVKVYMVNGQVNYELLRGNNSGYQSKVPYDTFRYVCDANHAGAALLIRKLLIRDSHIRTDTFQLAILDTLYFNNQNLLKTVFYKPGNPPPRALKIFVLKSFDGSGSLMLHYWVERVGIIKLTDEKCWRYSFELTDTRTKAIQKMFVQLIRLITATYKDPYWLSQPCGVETE